MATYKVIQDIEAEDKFIGPLTLKQFIFASVSLVSLYLGFFLYTRGVWVTLLLLIPVALVSGFLAFPWGRDQPTEIWLLAKIHFYFKPRKRIWDQSGMQQLVRITAPPKVNEFVSDNLNQTEVKSRLKALADTIDSRGWVVKNVSSVPSYSDSTDRLVQPENILPKVKTEDNSMNDIFDESKSLSLDNKIQSYEEKHRTDIVDRIEDVRKQNSIPTQQNNYWFLNEPKSQDPNLVSFTSQHVETNNSNDLLGDNFASNKPVTAEDYELLNKIKEKKQEEKQLFRNHKNIDPYSINNKPAYDEVTRHPTPDTIRLARSDSRTIESLQREGEKRTLQDNNDNEVIVSLH